MTKLIGYLGGTRIDYQGFPAKGGVLSDDINAALESMRKAKIRANMLRNALWRDGDYIEITENNGSIRKLLMKNVWKGKL